MVSDIINRIGRAVRNTAGFSWLFIKTCPYTTAAFIGIATLIGTPVYMLSNDKKEEKKVVYQLNKAETDDAKSLFFREGDELVGYFPVIDNKICSPFKKDCIQSTLENGCFYVNLEAQVPYVKQIPDLCMDIDGTKYSVWMSDKASKAVNITGATLGTLISETYNGARKGVKKAAHAIKRDTLDTYEFFSETSSDEK